MLRNIDSLIPPSQVSSAFAQTKQFFDLPMEVKEKLAWECPESNRGYVAEGRERVTQESSKEAIEKLRAQAPGEFRVLSSPCGFTDRGDIEPGCYPTDKAVETGDVHLAADPCDGSP